MEMYPVLGPPNALGPHPHSRKSQALLHHRAGRRRRRERWCRGTSFDAESDRGRMKRLHYVTGLSEVSEVTTKQNC